MGTADVIEIIWTTISFLGVVLSSFSFLDAYKSFRTTIINQVDRAFHILAGASVRRESLRIAQQVLFTLSGVGALFRPSDGNPYTVARLLIIAFLLTGSLLITINAALDIRARHRIRASLNEERKE